MDRDNHIADVMTGEELFKMWDAGQWEVAVSSGTAYLILEQEKSSGDVSRVLADRGEGALEFLQSLDGGFLVKRQIALCWE